MISRIIPLTVLLNCSPSPPSPPTYPGMCEEYYQQLEKAGNILSKEGKEWCQELCESEPVKDHYECSTMYCCLEIGDCGNRHWEKPEYIDCLKRFGEKPYRL